MKGISALLASVLLVAFVVSVSLLVSGWFTTLTSSTTESVGNKSGEAIGCSSAAIAIKGVYVSATNAPGTAGSARAIVENTGYTDNLVITSAELYDRLGNNFTASNMPIAEFDQGKLTTLSFAFPVLGSTTNDTSGNGNNGTLINGTAWTLSGKYGSSLSFDGIDDYVDAGNGASFNNLNYLTIEAWYKTATASLQDLIVTKHSEGTSGSFYLGIIQTGKMRFMLTNSASSRVNLDTTTDYNDGNLHHVAATYDGSIMKMYIDGNFLISASQSGTIQNSGYSLLIGRPSTIPDWFFNGTIDDVRIYNISLTNEEINRTMNGEIINQSDLVMYMKLDEASGVLQCSDFSRVVVTTSCGGVADTFSSTPTC